MELRCTRCIPCRVQRRREWTARLLLESQFHAHSWFVTLTYADKHLPQDQSVDPREIQLFMKKLRKAVSEPLRFYAVGEYGGQYHRPHYHIALFGLGDYGHVQPGDTWAWGLPECTCPLCKCWGKGGVDRRPLEKETAQYICKHAVEKATEDNKRIVGERHPVFARMSNGGKNKTGGIGAQSAETIANAHFTKAVSRSVSDQGDVLGVVRFDGQMWPLGRYLRGRVRKAMGMDPRMPTAALERLQRKQVEELSVPGARHARDQKRVQVERVYRSRSQIASSKKGRGL